MSRANELECVISDLSAECLELHNKVAAQAAVIEFQKDALKTCEEESTSCGLVTTPIVVMMRLNTHGKHYPSQQTAQILDEVRKQEREKCADLCEKSDRYRGDYFAAKIRAME